ncbi:ANL_collapsed_G0042160.mRNA.1.CDS.1 [Saccharomyces cerevisiae]|nr:ANL_collapsed_G0042160.mRNA.1.CDS.1 [Saccharomyces cerevisiae]
MSQKDNLLTIRLNFLKRSEKDLDVIKEESEARISKEHSKVSESNKKLNAERINVAKLEET